MVARWAHNPKVNGSNPFSVIFLILYKLVSIKFLFTGVNIFLIFLILVFLPSVQINSYGEFFGSPKSESTLFSGLIWILIFIYILLAIFRSQVLL